MQELSWNWMKVIVKMRGLDSLWVGEWDCTRSAAMHPQANSAGFLQFTLTT